MNERGFTLLEALISLAILGIVLVALVPTFQTFLNANTLSEERSNAVAAAQRVMEVLRHQDPASLPSSGSSAIQAVSVGEHEYEVVTHYCQESKYCGTDIRHIVVEVSFAAKVVYTVETVFTRLR
jgi:prepilin-type N-terminal cleavage/methylation domain-containing protein